ncbi:hypothetical protein [uncultured Bacteroides sp.]|uniref:hypothetical protein n=1 Tax=uncultured Bacteroides sp. TaxID=162156 RepID=UPI0025DFD80D|nr:hypothetical protein [uncultured Bacteroides sp.]
MVYSDVAKVKGDSGKKLEFFIKTISGNEVPCIWERQFPCTEAEQTGSSADEGEWYFI